jgi:putative membrane protein
MLRVLLYFVTSILTILGLSILLPTFEVTGLYAALMYVIFLTLLNFTVIPVIKFLTFPINFLTLGLFHGLINIFTIGVVANTVKGVNLTGTTTDKFFTAIVIAISLSVVHTLVGKLGK